MRNAILRIPYSIRALGVQRYRGSYLPGKNLDTGSVSNDLHRTVPVGAEDPRPYFLKAREHVRRGVSVSVLPDLNRGKERAHNIKESLRRREFRTVVRDFQDVDAGKKRHKEPLDIRPHVPGEKHARATARESERERGIVHLLTRKKLGRRKKNIRPRFPVPDCVSRSEDDNSGTRRLDRPHKILERPCGTRPAVPNERAHAVALQYLYETAEMIRLGMRKEDKVDVPVFGRKDGTKGREHPAVGRPPVNKHLCPSGLPAFCGKNHQLAVSLPHIQEINMKPVPVFGSENSPPHSRIKNSECENENDDFRLMP